MVVVLISILISSQTAAGHLHNDIFREAEDIILEFWLSIPCPLTKNSKIPVFQDSRSVVNDNDSNLSCCDQGLLRFGCPFFKQILLSVWILKSLSLISHLAFWTCTKTY